MTDPRDDRSPPTGPSQPPTGPARPPATPRAGAGGNSLASRPLDRRALERVIGRAAELQARMASAPEVMSEAEILEVGREVGLSPDNLRQAMAEERTRVIVPEESGWVARTFGAGAAEASRVVPGRPAEVLAAVDGWMQKEECLVLKRRFGDRITWEPSNDFFSQLRRDFSGGKFALSKAHEIAATVTAVDDYRTFVRLDVDLEPKRRGAATASGISAAVGVGTSAVTVGVASAVLVPTALAFAAVAAVAALPVAFGAGAAYLIARGQSQSVHRVQLALEQVLDRLEHGQLRPKPSVTDQLRSAFDSARKWK